MSVGVGWHGHWQQWLRGAFLYDSGCRRRFPESRRQHVGDRFEGFFGTCSIFSWSLDTFFAIQPWGSSFFPLFLMVYNLWMEWGHWNASSRHTIAESWRLVITMKMDSSQPLLDAREQFLWQERPLRLQVMKWFLSTLPMSVLLAPCCLSSYKPMVGAISCGNCESCVLPFWIAIIEEESRLCQSIERDGEVVDQSLDMLYKIARMPGIMKKMMHSLVSWSSPKTAMHLEGITSFISVC